MTAPLIQANRQKITEPHIGFMTMVKHNHNLTASRMYTVDVNKIDLDGFTPLYWAVTHHNMHNLELLMYFGATLEVSNNKNALFYAIECDNIEALKYFIEKGIEKNITRTNASGDTYTLLEYAQRLKRERITKYLK